MNKKDLPDSVVVSINRDVEELNSISATGDEWRRIVKKKQARIIQQLEKELKLVPQYHYRNMWLAVEMAAFGIPLVVAIGVSFRNMVYLGIGMPIGWESELQSVQKWIKKHLMTEDSST